MDVSDLCSRLAERDGGRPEPASADAAWLVLEAASDLGDEPAVAACRRVIDAGLNGRTADHADLLFVQNYFR
ncbi:hypothetical protein [Bradyrhizobium sp. Tv2a-2]|uniref:hypothetical protein n=1 Tax=Bradyrhizobium sp. Tv2a-2 TaxID=113395 RepID=UPI0004247DE2|nr:hypothetical protein [Bradyrhizobium sp. Tv2a-2]